MHYCYLITSGTQRVCYIGYCRSPQRRIRQHNGLIKGGAKRTSKGRPWSFTCVVGPFPNNTCALMFEWQWQHPAKARQIGSMKTKGPKMGLGVCLEALGLLLASLAWERLKLTAFFFDVTMKDKYQSGQHGPGVRGLLLEEQEDYDAVLKGANAKGHKDVHVHVGGACGFCTDSRRDAEALFWSCSTRGCRAPPIHLTCLARMGMSVGAGAAGCGDGGKAVEAGSISVIPRRSTCPSCAQQRDWINIVRASGTRSDHDEGETGSENDEDDEEDEDEDEVELVI